VKRVVLFIQGSLESMAISGPEDAAFLQNVGIRAVGIPGALTVPGLRPSLVCAARFGAKKALKG
jgi:hypothetical protein